MVKGRQAGKKSDRESDDKKIHRKLRVEKNKEDNKEQGDGSNGIEVEDAVLIPYKKIMGEKHGKGKKKADKKTGAKGKKKQAQKPKADLSALAKRVQELRNRVLAESPVEYAPAEDHSKFDLLAKSLIDVIWTTDMELSFNYISPSVKNMLGFTEKEAMSKNLHELLTETSFEDFREFLEEELENEKAEYKDLHRNWIVELEHYKKDEDTVWTECRMTFLRDKLDQPSGILGVTRDITKRKQAEDELMHTLEKYKGLYESSKDGILITGLDGIILDANQAYLDMLGYSIYELKNLKYNQLTPPIWRDMEMNIIKHQIAKRGYSDEYEKEYIAKDGTIIPIAMRVWLMNDAEGEPTGFGAIIRDITIRKQMEEKIRRNERRLKLITENTSDFIVICDLDGTLDYVSPSHNKLYYSEEELTGTNIFDYVHPNDKEEMMIFLESALLDDQDKVGSGFEFRMMDKAGRWHLLESTMNITKTHRGQRGTIVMISRISYKKRKSRRRFRL